MSTILNTEKKEVAAVLRTQASIVQERDPWLVVIFSDKKNILVSIRLSAMTEWRSAPSGNFAVGQGSSTELRGDRATGAYLEIRDLIVTGALLPGGRLVEAELADRLGISRTPVRAALQRLREEGFVQEIPRGRRSRLFVAPLTKEDGAELFYLLAEIDGLAAYFAAGLPDESRHSLTEELSGLNDRLRASANRGETDGETYFRLDEGFHQRYWNAARHPRVSSILSSIKPQTERYIRAYTRAWISEIPRSVRDHDAIVAAIEAGDPNAAQDAGRANYRTATERLVEVAGQVGRWES